MPSTKLARAGAQLVHPDLAFVIRHIPLHERVERVFASEKNMNEAYVSTNRWEHRSEDIPLPQRDYILRLHGAVETLFGPLDFDLQSYRTYPTGELPFHVDPDEDLTLGDSDLLDMVTCIHNAGPGDRGLTFRKQSWTNVTESFQLTIPAKAILVFGESLMFEYEHGIPASPGVAEYRSVVTRFARWSETDE